MALNTNAFPSKKSIRKAFIIEHHIDVNIEKYVRVEGLEPPRREALDPKSSMSTNFITPA